MAYQITTTVPWQQTMRDLDECFRKWHVYTWSVRPLKPPRADRAQSVFDRAVTLTYNNSTTGRPVVLSMNKQERAQDNLRVLYLAVEAMRLNELRGIAEVVATAYAQLEAPPSPDPYEVFEVVPGTPLALVETLYRDRMKAAHPDAGGSVDEAARLNAAMDAIRKEQR